MHPLLKRQLKRLGLAVPTLPLSSKEWDALLERVSNAYAEADQGRELLERSLALSSKEMQQLYEDLRQSSELELKDREKETQNLIDHALDGIISINPEGKILTWNPQATAIFGWSKEQVLGKILAELIIPQKLQAAHKQGLEDFAKTRSGKVTNKRLEMTARHQDNREFPIEISIIPINQGDTYFFYVLVRDITQQRMAEQAMLHAKETAERAARAKSEFLATMSHEIRTPMNGIIGMTGLLMETELTPSQRQFAQTVKISGEALLTIINDILDFSKIEAGKLDFEVINFDLRIAVEETLELLAEKAGSKKLELVGLVSAQVPTALQGDPGRFRQILLNLISNAIKFTQVGEVIVRVSLQSETETHATIKVEVQDTGIGIPNEKQATLFQPFAQGDSSTTRKYGGTGLGLAICRQLVEQMGGGIGLESQGDQGSTFWFTAKFLKQPPSQTPSSQTLSLKGLRLCCVDDHEPNLELMAQYATDWEMDVTTTSTPAGALAMLQTADTNGTPFDLAIIDMEMPGMDGMTLARVIKGNPNLSTLPLVLLTSLGQRGDAQLAKKSGFSGYLTKPIRKDVLESCLGTVLGLHTLESAATNTQLVTRFSAQESQQQNVPRILVADDHQVNQQLAILLLERLGFRSDVVGNGKEAVDAALKIPYDLIFMDCQMPEMDGYEATRTIRKQEKEERQEIGCREQGPNLPQTSHSPHVPIIAITANAMQGDREKCLQAGMDDYISKPIRPKELSKILEKWIPQRNVSSSNTIELADSDSHSSPSSLKDSLTVNGQTIQDLLDLGGQELLQSTVQEFLEDALECSSLIEQAIDDQNYAQLVKTTHGLKGIARNMGADELAQVAEQVEAICKTRNPEALKRLQRQLKNTINRTQEELEGVLKKT